MALAKTERLVSSSPGPKIKLGPFCFAYGIYADLWHGYIEGNLPAVTVKVWRRAKLSKDTLRDVEKVRKPIPVCIT